MTIDLVVENLVDQFNYYRHIDILFRIRQCHSNMQLNDLCERYSVNNRTYSLERVSVTPFRSFDHLTDTLIDRATVEKLRKLCSPARWCLGDLPPNDVNLTISLFQQHARSLCSLDQCRPRLLTFINTCPSLTNKVRFCSETLLWKWHLHVECEHSDLETAADVLHTGPTSAELESKCVHGEFSLRSSSSLCILG